MAPFAFIQTGAAYGCVNFRIRGESIRTALNAFQLLHERGRPVSMVHCGMVPQTGTTSPTSLTNADEFPRCVLVPRIKGDSTSTEMYRFALSERVECD